MSIGRLAPLSRLQVVGPTGAPYAGAKRLFYLAGTATPATVYQDFDLATPHPATIVADSAGRFPAVYLDPTLSYKEIVRTAGDVDIYEQDHLSLGGGLYAVISHAGNYSVASSDGQNIFLEIDAGSGHAIVDLFTAVGQGGRVVLVKKVDGSANTVTVDPLGGQTADGVSTLTLRRQWDFVALVSNNANWRVISTPVVDVHQDRRSEGRLTLTSGTAVTVTDVTAATAVYFTPHGGNVLGLYDGDNWVGQVFAELTLDLSGLPANTNYDVFAYLAGSTLTLEAVAWTDGTTRATALALQDGVCVKSGATTHRYLGSFRTTGTIGQTEDSAAKRFLWNLYHRVSVPVRVLESTDSWTYTTDTWRQANAAAGNQVAVLCGLAFDAISLRLRATAANSSGTMQFAVSIGEDSTSTPSTAALGLYAGVDSDVTGMQITTVAYLDVHVPLGYHYYAWLERSGASGTTTWYGDNGQSTMRNGLTGTWAR